MPLGVEETRRRMEEKEEEKKKTEEEMKKTEAEIGRLEQYEEVKEAEKKEEALEADIRALEAELNVLWEKTARSGNGGLKSAMIQKLGDVRGVLQRELVKHGLLKEEEVRDEVIRERMEMVKKNVASLERDVLRMEEEGKEMLCRVKKEEGKKESIEAEIRWNQQHVTALTEEVKAQYLQLDINVPVTVEGYSAALQWALTPANALTVREAMGCDVKMTTAFLTALAQHYLILQCQERVIQLEPQTVQAEATIRVGEGDESDD